MWNSYVETWKIRVFVFYHLLFDRWVDMEDIMDTNGYLQRLYSMVVISGNSTNKNIKPDMIQQWKDGGKLKSDDYRMRQPNFRAIKRGVPGWRDDSLKNKCYFVNKDDVDEKIKMIYKEVSGWNSVKTLNRVKYQEALETAIIWSFMSRGIYLVEAWWCKTKVN